MRQGTPSSLVVICSDEPPHLLTVHPYWSNGLVLGFPCVALTTACRSSKLWMACRCMATCTFVNPVPLVSLSDSGLTFLSANIVLVCRRFRRTVARYDSFAWVRSFLCSRRPSAVFLNHFNRSKRRQDSPCVEVCLLKIDPGRQLVDVPERKAVVQCSLASVCNDSWV